MAKKSKVEPTMSVRARSGQRVEMFLEPGASIVIRLGQHAVPNVTPHVTLTADPKTGFTLRAAVFPNSLIIEPESYNAAHLSQGEKR